MADQYNGGRVNPAGLTPANRERSDGEIGAGSRGLGPRISLGFYTQLGAAEVPTIGFEASGISSGVVRDGPMEEIDHSTHACGPDKVAVRDKIQFGHEHLLGGKKTSEVGIVIGGQARQYR